MSHISNALLNVSFLITLKDHQTKEAEVSTSETLYVVLLFNVVQSQGHVNTFDPLGSLIPSKPMQPDLLKIDNSKKMTKAGGKLIVTWWRNLSVCEEN